MHRTSLVRLLATNLYNEKWPVLRQLLQDASPLVRSSAALALSDGLTGENVAALLSLTADPVRLVRIRAAEALAPIPASMATGGARQSFEAAQAELLSALNVRPDIWTSHYNLGNYYSGINEVDKAIASYKTALQLEPRAVLPLTNLAMMYGQRGEYDMAETSLRKALEIEPNSAPVRFNLGLLMVEKGNAGQAEKDFRAALDLDPRLAPAAYNLGLLIIEERPEEGLMYCRTAYELSPGDPKYGYSFAFFQAQTGDREGAVMTLENTLKFNPGHLDSLLLLGAFYTQDGKVESAREIYQHALSSGDLSDQDALLLRSKLQELEGKKQ